MKITRKNNIDAILVPGGGLTETGQLPLWTRRRLDRALELHNDQFIITLSAGTVHKPPAIDAQGFPLFECTAAANYLIEKGTDPKKILREHASYDTIGNAYFARVIHTDPRQWRRLLVITSEFHVRRTQEIFNWIFSLDRLGRPYEMEFMAVTDEGIGPKIIQARIQKEQRALQNVRQLKANIKTLKQFHEWLFVSHGAYSLAAGPHRESGDLLKSY